MTTDAANNLIVIRGLRKSFQHQGRTLEVLKGIDLDVKQGEILSIVGASGAGKSTLLHCVGTLDIPTSGTILLDGADLTKMGGAKLASVRNRTIGFVFQFHHLLPEFTAFENVVMPGLIGGRGRREMAERANLLLREVGLEHRATHRPGELSGGEQQRVAIARALALEPKLLLADEPTGNLDSVTSDAIHDLFYEISDRHGTTIIVVTHNPGFAQRMPRVVEMTDGRVVADGPGSLHEPPAAAPGASPTVEAEAHG